MAAAEAVYDCRVRAAALFDAQPEQIVFTMNATHALNMAIRTLVSPGDRVLISGFEHNAVVRPLYALGAETVIAGRALFDPDDTLRHSGSGSTAESARSSARMFQMCSDTFFRSGKLPRSAGNGAFR